jgi:hypothetical protein
MKFIIYILTLLTVSSFGASKYATAQQPLNQINITSFIVKNKLPADVSTWNAIPGCLLLVAQKLPQAQLKEIKLVLQIKQGGNRLCGTTTQATVAMDAFAVRNFNASELLSMLAQCPKLSASSYSLCAQFFNIDNYPISREFCKEFMVGDVVLSYTAPQNISPANEKKLEAIAAKTPITFRWTPVIPRPKDPVLYRLRVWQLMQGQTGVQAMKANEPIVDKEVKSITQTVLPNMLTTPCQLPYLCEFVWAVQALDKEGKPIGKNEGMGELFSFKIKTN